MLRKALALGFAALAVASTMRAAGKTVSYKSGAEKVSGYLALPEGSGKKPAIVVIHEWYGLNDFPKSKADAFAAQGYVALAVDLYRGKVATDPDTAHQLMRGLPEDRVIRDLKAAVEYLRSRPDVEGSRIASIGWCMGGGYSLQLALAEPTLSGAVIYYGSLPTDPKTIQSLRVPLEGSFGGQDQGIPPESVQEFRTLARRYRKNVDFKIYPDAGHQFASSTDPSIFRPADAKDANARTDGFLNRVLKGTQAKG